MKRFDLAMVRNRDLILGEGSLDESIEKICMNISENSSDWSFVHVSDLHVGSPRSYRFQPAWIGLISWKRIHPAQITCG